MNLVFNQYCTLHVENISGIVTAYCLIHMVAMLPSLG